MNVICAGIRLLNNTYLRIPLFIIALIFTYKAQCHALEEDEYRFDVTLHGGFYTGSEEAWLLEVSGCWDVHRYVGLSFGMEVTQQIMMRGHSIMIDGKKAYLDSDYLNIAWIMFKPSVLIL